MIGVYLPAVNTLSSQVFIPVDISRMTSGYIQHHKHSLLFKKNKLPHSFCMVLVFVNVHFCLLQVFELYFFLAFLFDLKK